MRTSLAVLVLLAGAAGARADDRSDLDRIQGKWQTMIGPGKATPLTMEIKGSDLTLSFTGPDGPVTLKGQLRLDPEKSPRQMDWVKMNRDGAPLPDNLAIYELDGDTLKVRGSGLNKERPSEFAKEGKDAAQTLTFRRPKDDKEGAKKDEPRKDEPKKDEPKGSV